MPLPRQTVINNLRTNRERLFEFTMPSDVPSGLFVGCLMDQVDLDDPGISFTFGMEYWWEPDQAWLLHASATFVGGPNRGKDGGPTPPPSFRLKVWGDGLSPIRGLQCRAFVRPISGACNISVEIEGFN